MVKVLAGVLKADLQRFAGKVDETQSVIDAAAEGDAGRNREITRKKNLLRAISSQQAKAGAAGVAFSEGSPARIAQLDIDEATDDLLIDTASTRQAQRQRLTQGRIARFVGKRKSTLTLLDTAAEIGESLAAGGGS